METNNELQILTRRDFIKTTATGVAALGLATGTALAADTTHSKRKFTLCLSLGMIGVSGNEQQLVDWAAQYGFESLEPPTSHLTGGLSKGDLKAYREKMKSRNLAWGAAGLPVEFRRGESDFEQGMKSLPSFAQSLQSAEITRVATWLMPSDPAVTYMANFRMHVRRLREVARVLGDHNIRLGLEYVGPKTAWASSRFPFIHTMAEMKDLIAEINLKNVGFLLDSWHWYTAEETEADLLTLKADDVVMCHLNDAPKGVPVSQQVDNRRELPCATGVIDTRAYLGALVKIGYDGPLACEPFSQELRQMPADQALSTVAAAMKKAVGLI